MAHFITADTHFGHYAMLNLETRKHFESIEEMNETIIKNWNNKVGGEDTVYHLGDIALKMSNRPLFDLLKRLNGKIIFVKGNHDSLNTFNWLERENYDYAKGRKFTFHEVGLIVPENKKEYYLSHYPIDLGYESAKRRNFHGHIHEKTVDKESCLNVGIDSPEVGDRPFGEPIEWREAVAILEEKFRYTLENKSLNYQVIWLDEARGIRKEHGQYNSIEEAYQSIEEWWKLHRFEPPYVRWLEQENFIRIDYGSHTQFYEIVRVKLS